MRLLTSDDFYAFVASMPVAAVHFDAPWNGTGVGMRRSMAAAEAAMSGRAALGEVDCDAEPDLSRSVGVVNVPAVAYFREGQLVATVVGVSQNVGDNLEAILRGEPVSRSYNRWSRRARRLREFIASISRARHR